MALDVKRRRTTPREWRSPQFFKTLPGVSPGPDCGLDKVGVIFLPASTEGMAIAPSQVTRVKTFP